MNQTLMTALVLVEYWEQKNHILKTITMKVSLNAVKCNLMELTTRSVSLAFMVSGVMICACTRIPCVLGSQG